MFKSIGIKVSKIFSLFFVIGTVSIGGFQINAGASANRSGETQVVANGGPILNFTGVGIDYDPEVRCADNENTNQWSPGRTPTACNPQPSFTCPPNSNTLFNCPTRCQSCFDGDLNVIKNTLGVTAITIYQPNFYILKAAKSQGVKVIFGIFNDSVVGLAKSETETDCTYAGSPLEFCGTKYAEALLDGACFDTSPWNPNMFCGEPGAFITAFGEFFEDGTVIGVQLGNEVLSTSIGLTKDEVVMAAQNMRTVLDQRNYSNIPIIVSLVAGNEEKFCENGAPPGDVDLIAAHPYCNFVASVPPSWPLDGAACLDQIQTIYNNNAVKFCGAENTFIGETGYNTGCPVSEGTSHIADAKTFIEDLVSWQCGKENNPPVSPPGATFMFAFVDACPETGCLPGCSGGFPNVGNGYFGIYHTANYLTTGELVSKFDTIPILSCQQSSDTDGDGIENGRDFDADNDGIPDSEESASNETKSQKRSVSMQREIPGDPDEDGIPNELDLDSDGDGIPDHFEAGGTNDGDRDGLVDDFVDQDGDGHHDSHDEDQGGTAPPLPDTDGDDTPDFLDEDSDGDGICDVVEAGGIDEDGDCVVDDSEDLNGDGLADSVHPDTGTPLELLDSDGDGIFDHLDSNDSTVQGGGGCSIGFAGITPSMPLLIALLSVFIAMRRAWSRYKG